MLFTGVKSGKVKDSESKMISIETDPLISVMILPERGFRLDHNN